MPDEFDTCICPSCRRYRAEQESRARRESPQSWRPSYGELVRRESPPPPGYPLSEWHYNRCPVCQQCARRFSLGDYEYAYRYQEHLREVGVPQPPVTPPANYPEQYARLFGERHYASCSSCQEEWPPASAAAEMFDALMRANGRAPVPLQEELRETLLSQVPRRQRAPEHGQQSGVTAHREKGEEPCASCQRYVNGCGTLAGFRKHLDKGEKACAECLDAEMRDLDAYYSAGSSERNWMTGNHPGNVVT